MGLDEARRAKIVQPNNPNENFDHLKIECRTEDKHHQHEAFGDQLLNIMKSVKNKLLKKIKKIFFFFSFHLKVIQVI